MSTLLFDHGLEGRFPDGVTGDRELPDKGAGNLTPVLWESMCALDC